MENNYQYRGIYDAGELDRIEALLAEQSKSFNQMDATENSFQKQAIKYGVIFLGIATLIIILKLIKK